jgi:hypothetical protein
MCCGSPCWIRPAKSPHAANTQADPRDWLPGEHILTQSLAIPATMKPGDYTLAMALVNPGGDVRPFRLAIETPEKDGRYLVSRVKIE